MKIQVLSDEGNTLFECNVLDAMVEVRLHDGKDGKLLGGKVGYWPIRGADNLLICRRSDSMPFFFFDMLTAAPTCPTPTWTEEKA